MTKTNIIECRDVSVRYGKVTVLEGIRFVVPERTTLCMVGPNGGGKSTLLKVLLGLIRPQSGEVRILGKEPQRARMQVGYMPQYVDFDPLFPIDVEGIVRMGRLRSRGVGFYNSADRSATRKALEEVGLWDLRREAYFNLSGGMKQRVLIARALVNDPDILLLDEPTAMVDAHIEAKLLKQLQSLHNRMTILLVSHDATFVSGLVDEVLCVNRTAEFHPLAKVEDHGIKDLYGDNVQAVLHSHHGHGHPHHQPEHKE